MVYKSLVVAALACLSTADAFGLGGVPTAGACRGAISGASKACTAASSGRPSLITAPKMSTMESASSPPNVARANDVLADLNELDSVMGVETLDQQDLKPKQAYLNKLAGQAAQLRWRKHDGDSGSAQLQVAILTEKIVYLTKHMQANPHDYHSRRGLITMVNKRRTQLNYYFREEPQNCLDMCTALGIRFRPKTKVRSREQRYAAFRNTKSKIGTARRTEIINKERAEQMAAAEAKREAERIAKGYQ